MKNHNNERKRNLVEWFITVTRSRLTLDRKECTHSYEFGVLWRNFTIAWIPSAMMRYDCSLIVVLTLIKIPGQKKNRKV